MVSSQVPQTQTPKNQLQLAVSGVPSRSMLPGRLRQKLQPADILREELPFEDALWFLKTQPEARALFESPRDLEQLQILDEIKKFICVLKNPVNGNLVYLIGTCHVSKASANDVRMLIEAVRPDTVTVEMDPDKLELIESGSNPFAGARYPLTTWKVLLQTSWILGSSLEKIRKRDFFYNLFMAQALGVTWGCDMMSAIECAGRLKIPVKAIDRCFYGYKETERLLLEARNAGGADSGLSVVANADSTLETLDQILSNPATWQPSSDGRSYFTRLLSGPDGIQESLQIMMFGCDTRDQEQIKAAYGRVLEAFRKGRPVPLSDVATFRSRVNKGLEKWRHEGFIHSNSEEDSRAYQNRRRDAVMAARLAGLADRHDITRVVAVVGAAHVPGIRDKFADYTLMQSINWDGHQRFSSAIRAGEHAKQEKDAAYYAVAETTPCRTAAKELKVYSDKS